MLKTEKLKRTCMNYPTVIMALNVKSNQGFKQLSGKDDS
jgi:hypothetical protein